MCVRIVKSRKVQRKVFRNLSAIANFSVARTSSSCCPAPKTLTRMGRPSGSGNTASLNRTSWSREGVPMALDTEPKDVFVIRKPCQAGARLNAEARKSGCVRAWLPASGTGCRGRMAISSCTKELKSRSVSLEGLNETLNRSTNVIGCRGTRGPTRNLAAFPTRCDAENRCRRCRGLPHRSHRRDWCDRNRLVASFVRLVKWRDPSATR